MVGRPHAEPLGEPPGAEVQLERAGLLALDVDPAANAPVGVAVPVANALLERLERAGGIGEEMVANHLLGPAARQLGRRRVGGVPRDDAANPGLLGGAGRHPRIVLRPHVEKAGRPAAQHLGGAEQHADPLVLVVDVRVEGLRPVEDPGPGGEVVGKDAAREGFGEVDVRVDEAGDHAHARSRR